MCLFLLWTPNRFDISYLIFSIGFLWNAFGRHTRVFHGRFTSYLNGILEFCICLVMTEFAVPIFIEINFYLF